MEVFTGDVKGGGTDANVFISIFGDKGDSGERALRNSETNRDKFERNKVRPSSSSSCARSVADISDHGLPNLSVVSSPDELIVGRPYCN